jgi:hypothetical protein
MNFIKTNLECKKNKEKKKQQRASPVVGQIVKVKLIIYIYIYYLLLELRLTI